MTYEWLFSFVVFAEHLNFTRAAAVLHLSQPALHAQIRKLGDEVGVELYRRQGRGLVLTEAGRRLAAFGRDVRARGGDVLAELRGETSRGPVVLAAGQGALLHLLGPALRRFPKERWPLRVLSMPGPRTVEAVQDARADVGVAVVATVPAELEHRPLCTIGQRVVLPPGHRLASRKTIRPAELDGETLVVAPEGSPHRVMLEQALATAGARFTVAVEATGWEPMIHFARLGLGLTVVNDFCAVPRPLVSARLSGVPEVTYSLLTRTGPSSEARDALARLIVQTCGA